MKLNQLVKVINETDSMLVSQAGKSVNKFLTIRNWLIGYRIVEYEQFGEDRAKYGDNTIKELSKLLQKRNVAGCSITRLKIYRKFYQAYQAIGQTLSDQFEKQMYLEKENSVPKVSIKILLENLPFSSFVEFIKINDPLKRSFYEVECLRGQWSTRELRRQIASQYYERSAYSTNKNKLTELIHGEAETLGPKDIIRDSYVFEFLRIKPQEALRENNLRDALLDRLQDFLLEKSLEELQCSMINV